MNRPSRSDIFHGLFVLRARDAGGVRLESNAAAPATIPDPETGRPLKVASVEVSDRGICPSCTQRGAGGYVSFVADMRLAFACPSCQTLVWVAGA